MYLKESEAGGYTQACDNQRIADGLTNVRLHGSLPLAATMAVTEPNWYTTSIDAALWATDMADGNFARKAREHWPELERTDASLRDPEADKRKFYGGLGAIAIRAFRERDIETAAIVAVNVGTSALRDSAMRKSRQTAADHHLSEDAITVDKYKTCLHAGASVLLASPLARYKPVRRTALALLSTGTILGLVGRRLYNNQVQEQIRELYDPYR